MVENAWIFLEIKDSIIPTHPRGETFEQWRPFYLICKDIGYEIVINETLNNRESKGKKSLLNSAGDLTQKSQVTQTQPKKIAENLWSLRVFLK